jgi:uncharacterized Zn-binding protein involved in type VI secretion
MPATVVVNFMTVVHQQSNGMAMFFPDPCLTPSPAGPIPIPYPNIAQGSQVSEGSSSVKADGCPLCIQGSKFSMSSGDEAGSAGGGVITATIKGKAEFMNFSFDVKADGKMIARMLDPMVGNEMSGQPGNTPPSPELQAPLPGPPAPPAQSGDWDLA